ncbi:hypothetical protein OY671_011645, partial [Metschnikowia pulcherrima]
VRAADERAKPNAERSPGFTDSQSPSSEKEVSDERPIYPWSEQLKSEWSSSKAREASGADDAQTRSMSGRESPEGSAARLVGGTTSADPAVRKASWQGGKAAIDASTDPSIAYARQLDARDRELQKQVDER